MTTFSEADVERAALEWLSAANWQIARGSDIVPGVPASERDDFGQFVFPFTSYVLPLLGGETADGKRETADGRRGTGEKTPLALSHLLRLTSYRFSAVKRQT